MQKMEYTRASCFDAPCTVLMQDMIHIPEVPPVTPDDQILLVGQPSLHASAEGHKL